jgi:hypothetical protein
MAIAVKTKWNNTHTHKKGKNSSHLKAVLGFKNPYYFPEKKKKKREMEKNDE